MSKSKNLILLLGIAFLISTVAAANFYVGRNAEQAKRVWTEQQLQMAKKEKASLEKEVDDLSKARTALEGQVDDLTQQAKTVANQLAQEKRAREALTTELARARTESAQAKSQLDQERSDKEALTDDLSKAKQSYQALSNELTTLRQAKEALEKRVKEMLSQRAKESEQIVVTGPSVSSAQPAAAPSAASSAGPAPGKGEAKVLVVNRDFNFVVISMGSKDAVKKGDRYAVLRGNKPIMTVEVDKVYDNMSAANMLSEPKKGSEVREGDVVRPI